MREGGGCIGLMPKPHGEARMRFGEGLRGGAPSAAARSVLSHCDESSYLGTKGIDIFAGER